MRLRLWWLIACLLVAVPASAQITFPLTLKVQWSPNPAAENVEFYIVTVNGAASNVQASACTATLCEATFSINAAGPHTVSVQAVNLFATGLASSVTFSAVAPGKSNNVKITK